MKNLFCQSQPFGRLGILELSELDWRWTGGQPENDFAKCEEDVQMFGFL